MLSLVTIQRGARSGNTQLYTSSVRQSGVGTSERASATAGGEEVLLSWGVGRGSAAEEECVPVARRMSRMSAAARVGEGSERRRRSGGKSARRIAGSFIFGGGFVDVSTVVERGVGECPEMRAARARIFLASGLKDSRESGPQLLPSADGPPPRATAAPSLSSVKPTRHLPGGARCRNPRSRDSVLPSLWRTCG
jgi:hypothetical protein